MLKLATVRDFRINASAVMRQVERGGRVLVTRNSKPIAVLSPVPPGVDLEDFVLSSHPYFLKRYQRARQSPGVSLAELKKALHAKVPGRGKRSRQKADRKT